MPILTRVRQSLPFLKPGRIGRAWLYYTVARLLFRVKRDRVLVLSDSRSDISGNLEFIVHELRQKHPELELRVVLRENLSADRSVRDSFRLPFLIATSKFIVVDDFYPYIYRLTLRKGVHLIQAWHAAGAFKRVGYSRAGLPGGPSHDSIVHRGYTDTITSSEAIRIDYAEAFWMPIENVHAIGVPRTDVFFDAGEIADAATRVRERYGIRPDQKVVLFAPTFRGNGQKVAYYDFDFVDWAALAASLGDDTVMLVKIHPFVRDIPPILDRFPQFIDVSGEREITELLFATDVLVTDYSSVIFEFALLRRPIVFHVPDLDEYRGARDFYYPFDYYLCGPTTATTEELVAAIDSAEVDTHKLDAFLDYFMSACDGRSSERFVQRLIVDRLDEKPQPRTPWPPSSFAGIPGWSTAPHIPEGHSTLGRLWLRARRAIRRERRPGLVSVIMPVYNVEKFVEQSVRSVLEQSHRSIELIVVDDSSTDSTPEILRRLATEDARIRLFRKPNGGPNAARNFGIRRAHGQFLTFLDGDDIVLPGAYADMVASLTKTKSDFAVGSYERLRGDALEPPRVWISNAHSQDFSYVPVASMPRIMVNAVQWSKMYYRSFWDDYVKRFSVPGFYQDQLVSARAYGRARYIDVLSRPVVGWRLREDSSSMTQQLGTVANLEDRFRTSIEAVDILRESYGPKLADARLRQLMRFDFGTTVARVVAADDAYWAALVTGLKAMVEKSRRARVWEDISAQHRVLFFLIAEDRRADAVSFVEQDGRYPEKFPFEMRGPEMYVHLPFWGDPSVPEDLFRAPALQRETLLEKHTEPDETEDAER